MINEKKKSGKKDACYHKVKSRYSVWPSAYASGALVKCRKKGAKNWGNSTNESIVSFAIQNPEIAGMAAKGLYKAGKYLHSKIKKRRKEKAARAKANKMAVQEGKGVMPKKFSVKSGDKSAAGGLTAKGVARYRAANPGSKLKTAVTTKPSKLKKGSKSAKRRKSFCARMGGMKKRLTSSKTANDPNSRINKALRKWNC